jgi:predicted dehydrogenase/threonine dehydrogenase-like Zn-dependent dehydrogenase
MKQVLYRQGKALVQQVPVPQTERGTILVRVDHSAISIGTELSGMQASAVPMWKRAVQNPHLIKRAFHLASTNGILRTRQLVQEKATALTPIGYSAAGIVEEAGDGAGEFQPGDYVACSGAQCAHHAEYIRVPVNLAVPVPNGVPLSHAGTVALGAVALQGVRRAEPTIGETFVVVGLGILGQLVVQILQANGCRVIGSDPDHSRVELASRHGMHAGIDPQTNADVDQVVQLSEGLGADGVIITAATPSDTVISKAFRMCRKKGRVVLVGDVGLNLNRSDIYEKELDFRISTSYGPGRYDENYEEHGLDYPLGYVRWTENRNMRAYLQLLSEGRVKLDELISAVYPVEEAPQAYEQIQNGQKRPLMVLLKYSHHQKDSTGNDTGISAEREMNGTSELTRTVVNPTARAAGSGRVRIAVIGPGAFAKSMHLPNLQSLKDRYDIRAIASHRGHNAVAISQKYKATYATTDYEQILNDAEVDAVLICTRHHRHAEMTLQALHAGKHVLVEKPLALTGSELRKVEEFYTSGSGDKAPVLLTGFNRRFSPSIQHIHRLTEKRTNPMILSYVMNAGYISVDHWVHTQEGGGRNRGEACHIYDLFTFLTNSPVRKISTHHIKPKTQHYGSGDNFVATISFEDGSVATLTYTSMGAEKHPKEQMQVFVDGTVITLDDYRQVRIVGSQLPGVSGRISDKGHQQELSVFADAIQDGKEWPIPLWQQIQATEIALAVERQLTM